MRTLLSTVVLSVLSAPAFAFPTPQPVPEPETLALIAVGLVGVLASRLRQLVERAHAPVGPGGAPLPRIGSNPPR